MANFCGKCGTPLHTESQLCPSCNAEELEMFLSIPNFCAACGGRMDKQNGVCTNCGRPHAAAEPMVVPEVTAAAEPTVAFETAPTAAPTTVAYAVPMPTPIMPQTQPVQAAVAPTPTKKKVPAYKAVITSVLSVLLCVLLLASSMVAMVRVALMPSSIEKVYDSIDWSLTVNSFMPEDKNALFEVLQEYFQIHIDDQVLNRLMQKESIKTFVIDKVLQAKDCVANGQDLVITPEEIAFLLKSSSSEVERLIGVSIAPIADQLAVFMTNGKPLIIPLADIASEASFVCDLLDEGMLDMTLVILLSLSAIIVVLMVLNSAKQSLIGIGVDLLLIGAAVLTVSLVLPNLIAIPLIGTIVKSMLSSLLSMFVLPAAIAAVVGLLMIVTRILIGVFGSKKTA